MVDNSRNKLGGRIELADGTCGMHLTSRLRSGSSVACRRIVACTITCQCSSCLVCNAIGAAPLAPNMVMVVPMWTGCYRYSVEHQKNGYNETLQEQIEILRTKN